MQKKHRPSIDQLIDKKYLMVRIVLSRIKAGLFHKLRSSPQSTDSDRDVEAPTTENVTSPHQDIQSILSLLPAFRNKLQEKLEKDVSPPHCLINYQATWTRNLSGTRTSYQSNTIIDDALNEIFDNDYQKEMVKGLAFPSSNSYIRVDDSERTHTVNKGQAFKYDVRVNCKGKGELILYSAEGKINRKVANVTGWTTVDPRIMSLSAIKTCEMPPLHLAASQGDAEAVNKLLIDKQTIVDQRDTLYRTPLYLAVEGGHTEVVDKLLEHGADVRGTGIILELFTVKQLRRVGFTIKELLWETEFSLPELRVAGFEAGEFRTAGFTTTELKNAGFSAWNLKDAGVEAKALKDAGFGVLVLARAGFDAWKLREVGFAAWKLRGVGFSLTELQGAGFEAVELRVAGFSVAEFQGAGFGAEQLCRAGFGAGKLGDAGFSLQQLKDAGFGAEALKDAGVEAKALRTAGFGVRELFMGTSFTLPELRVAGFEAGEFRTAEFSARELKWAGFSVAEVQGAGFGAEQLCRAGFGAEALKDAGVEAKALRTAGFSAEELLLADEFSAEELRVAGFNAGKLEAAGFMCDKDPLGYSRSPGLFPKEPPQKPGDDQKTTSVTEEAPQSPPTATR